MAISRRQTLAAGLSMVGSTVFGSQARAQDAWPSNTIKFVIPSSVGGGFDTMMRLLGAKLTEAWGKPCIVEPRPGATGAIAASFVANSAPNGYTFGVGYSALLSNLLLLQNPGYKLSDLMPVSMMVFAPLALGVRSSLGVSTLKEFVALAKQSPGKLTYGSYGAGSGGHFAGALLSMVADIDLIHVPYKGETPAIQDVVSGQIDAIITSLGGIARYPEKIKSLAVASPTRFPVYTDVPTFSEAGYPEVNMPGFSALLAPSGTPQPIIDKMANELARVVKLPDVKPKLLDLGFDPAGWGPGQVKTFLDEQYVLTRKLVESGRVKI